MNTYLIGLLSLSLIGTISPKVEAHTLDEALNESIQELKSESLTHQGLRILALKGEEMQNGALSAQKRIKSRADQVCSYFQLGASVKAPELIEMRFTFFTPTYKFKKKFRSESLGLFPKEIRYKDPAHLQQYFVAEPLPQLYKMSAFHASAYAYAAYFNGTGTNVESFFIFNKIYCSKTNHN